MAASKEIEAEKAQAISELNRQTVGDALTAATFAIAATLDLDVSQQDFVEFAPNDVLSREDTESAKDILAGLADRRDEVKQALETASLARTVLPSFRQLSIQIDLRLKFSDDGTIEKSVPVSICSLDTDVQGDDVFFQAELDDIERMIEKLEKARDNMRRIVRAHIDL